MKDAMMIIIMKKCNHLLFYALSFIKFCESKLLLSLVVLKLMLNSVFFKENVRYPVWTCRDLISLILGTRFSLILGT